MSTKTACATYRLNANLETDPSRQVVLLYDGAIRFLNQAAAAIERKDLTAKADLTARALAIVEYLQAVLDFDRGGDVARVYDDLYKTVIAQVMQASVALDATGMVQAAALLEPVRNAWNAMATKPA